MSLLTPETSTEALEPFPLPTPLPSVSSHFSQHARRSKTKRRYGGIDRHTAANGGVSFLRSRKTPCILHKLLHTICIFTATYAAENYIKPPTTTAPSRPDTACCAIYHCIANNDVCATSILVGPISRCVYQDPRGYAKLHHCNCSLIDHLFARLPRGFLPMIPSRGVHPLYDHHQSERLDHCASRQKQTVSFRVANLLHYYKCTLVQALANTQSLETLSRESLLSLSVCQQT